MKPTTAPARLVICGRVSAGIWSGGAVGSSSTMVPGIVVSPGWSGRIKVRGDRCSVRADIGLLDELGPARDFVFQEFRGFLRRVADRLRALCQQLLGHCSGFDDRGSLGMHAPDD